MVAGRAEMDAREAGREAPVAKRSPEVKKVQISMPDWMLEDLRERARARGITVTELMRRAVSLERILFEDPDNEVVLRNTATGKESTIRLV